MLSAIPIKVQKGLEIIGGKYAELEPPRRNKTGQLVVKTSQRNYTDLTVYTVPVSTGKVHLAFCFKVKDNYYYPVVEWNPTNNKYDIKVEGPINESFDTFPDKFLFGWNRERGYGSLCSTLAQKYYLSESEGVLTLTPNPEFIFRINPVSEGTRVASGIPISRFLYSFRVVSVKYSDDLICNDKSDMKKTRRKQKSCRFYPYSCTN